ncbi:MAG: metallophosphoesterase [Candidatus Delongbacteria bacterium]|nr:metallophosphoesterase [Candidatus Delongbacteria bacterium]
MKIIILSDTHFRKGYSLSNKFIEELSDSDTIIHCGDFVSLEFYNFLNSSKQLIAVRGNNDYSLSSILSYEETFDIEGYKISVTHGHRYRLENIHYAFPDSDIIFYGHEHHPSIEKYENKLILSPGSLTSNRYVGYNSFMTVELNKNTEPVVKLHQI